METVSPIPMVLLCPRCGTQHIDAPEPETGWDNPPHKSHLCHGCGCIWRPAAVATTGVASVPLGERDTWGPSENDDRDRATPTPAQVTLEDAMHSCSVYLKEIEEMRELLSTLVYWYDEGHIDKSWWDEARKLAGQKTPRHGGD